MVRTHRILLPFVVPKLTPLNPSATGQSWEKYKKDFADDEIEEKKITPLTDEYDTMEPRRIHKY